MSLLVDTSTTLLNTPTTLALGNLQMVTSVSSAGNFKAQAAITNSDSDRSMDELLVASASETSAKGTFSESSVVQHITLSSASVSSLETSSSHNDAFRLSPSSVMMAAFFMATCLVGML